MTTHDASTPTPGAHRVVLWGARRHDIQLGSTTDKPTPPTTSHTHHLGELLNPLDIAPLDEWGHAG